MKNIKERAKRRYFDLHPCPEREGGHCGGCEHDFDWIWGVDGRIKYNTDTDSGTIINT